ncbi:MAG: NUDIX hydrolase [Pseudomonadota bacterium]
MHRQAILSLFDTYEARYPQESETVARIRTFVQSDPRCFFRELLVGHVTGSAWIVDATGTRALLTHHRKLNIWVQLGGHADGDPDIAAVAMREAEEESGLDSLRLVSPEIFDIDIHAIPARGDEPKHFHYDCRFLIQATRDLAFTVSDESHDLKWIALAEMTRYTTEESITRMVNKTAGWL